MDFKPNEIMPDRNDRGEQHNLTHSPEYESWRYIKRLCYGVSSTQYHLYGGKGIRVCRRWKNSFITFLEDMGKRPSKAHSIYRKDETKDYSPDNCFWGLKSELSRKNRISTITTKIGNFTTEEFKKKLGISDYYYDVWTEDGFTHDDIIEMLESGDLTSKNLGDPHINTVFNYEGRNQKLSEIAKTHDVKYRDLYERVIILEMSIEHAINDAKGQSIEKENDEMKESKLEVVSSDVKESSSNDLVKYKFFYEGEYLTIGKIAKLINVKYNDLYDFLIKEKMDISEAIPVAQERRLRLNKRAEEKAKARRACHIKSTILPTNPYIQKETVMKDQPKEITGNWNDARKAPEAKEQEDALEKLKESTQKTNEAISKEPEANEYGDAAAEMFGTTEDPKEKLYRFNGKDVTLQFIAKTFGIDYNYLYYGVEVVGQDLNFIIQNHLQYVHQRQQEANINRANNPLHPDYRASMPKRPQQQMGQPFHNARHSNPNQTARNRDTMFNPVPPQPRTQSEIEYENTMFGLAPDHRRARPKEKLIFTNHDFKYISTLLELDKSMLEKLVKNGMSMKMAIHHMVLLELVLK